MKHPERITKTHIYFWGSFYSQWAKYNMSYADIDFCTCEQYMMYSKALLFNDISTSKKILATQNSRKQKALGRTVKNFDQRIWDERKFKIVVSGNYLKFSQNNDIRQELLSTKDKIIVEGSPYDTIWGVGLRWDDDLILNETNWRGENLLGKALMRVRYILNSAE